MTKSTIKISVFLEMTTYVQGNQTAFETQRMFSLEVVKGSGTGFGLVLLKKAQRENVAFGKRTEIGRLQILLGASQPTSSRV